MRLRAVIVTVCVLSSTAAPAVARAVPADPLPAPRFALPGAGALAVDSGFLTASGQRLTGPWTPGVDTVAFSPDGSSIAWTDWGVLNVTDAAGSTRTLTDVGRRINSVRWSRSGARLAVAISNNGDESDGSIATVPLDGSAPPTVVIKGEKGEVTNVEWAADDSALLYVRRSSVLYGAGVDVFRYDLATSTHTQLTSNCTWATPGPPSKIAPTCAVPAWTIGEISLSPDGTRMTMVGAGQPELPGTRPTTLSVLDLTSGVSTVVLRNTDPAIAALGPYPVITGGVWSPDGSTIAASLFDQDRNANDTVLVPSVGGPATYLAPSGAKSWQACPTGSCPVFGTPPLTLKLTFKPTLGKYVVATGLLRPVVWEVTPSELYASIYSRTKAKGPWRKGKGSTGIVAAKDGSFRILLKRPRNAVTCKVVVVAPASWGTLQAKQVKKFSC